MLRIILLIDCLVYYFFFCSIVSNTEERLTMDADEFRQRGKEMVDFMADYLTTIRTRRVFPNVKPGYMRPLIDDEAPRQGEPWDNIFNDIERVIMPGVCSS
jgi:hypothetical protein